MSGSTTNSGQPLLPANVTLLQPGSRFFRLSDALNYQVASQQASNNGLQTQITTLQGDVTTLQSQMTVVYETLSTQSGQITNLQLNVNDLQSQINGLQSQIDTINARLLNAGIP